jgi:hypothetical protein
MKKMTVLFVMALIVSFSVTAIADTADRYLLTTHNSITATSTYDLLVDLSINSAEAVTAQSADITVTCSGEFEVKIGVVTETDATEGTVHFFWVQQFHPSTKTLYEVDFDSPVNAAVNIDDGTSYTSLDFSTNDTKTDNEFQNDSGDLTPVNGNGAVTDANWSRGDIVLVVEEITAGDLDLSCRFNYTERRSGDFVNYGR